MAQSSKLTFLVQDAWSLVHKYSVQTTVGLLFVYVLHVILVVFFLSPVCHIPGPWWARMSRLPLLWVTFQRRRSEYAAKMIDRYGPIVIIAPDQVHTNDDNAMKIIYNRKSLKTRFYEIMGSWKGVKSTLGFVDYPSATPTRNNLIQCSQNRNLEKLVENMVSHIGEFQDLISKSVKNKTNVDGVVVFRLLALDIVTDVLWGEQQTLSSQASDETPLFLQHFHAFSSWNALKSFIPALDTFVKFLGSTRLKQLCSDCHDLDITARDALARWVEHLESRRNKDVLSMLQSMNEAEDPRKRIPSDHTPAYIVEMLAAGSSTSHTAAFVCYQLAKQPATLQALKSELRTTFPDYNAIDERKMLDLPLLDSVIRETMRIFPMIPGPLERHLGDWIEVNGLRVPPGVIVSTSVLDQGRLSDVYPDPGSWMPERWLNATDRMKLNWIPFGHGSRSCPTSWGPI